MVTCLEYGCGRMAIPLTPNAKAPMGGKSLIGSLDAYKVNALLVSNPIGNADSCGLIKHHIRTHPTHAQSRNARLQSQVCARCLSICVVF
jgi:hypothetical protein